MNVFTRASTLCVALGVCGMQPCAVRAEQAPLRSPFTWAVQHAAHEPARMASCDPAPAAVRDIYGVSYYTDRLHSIPDPAKHAQNVAQLAPIRAYLDHVTRFADAAVRGDPPANACAWTWLRAWAAADAMTGSVNAQGAYEREWTLGGLAIAFLKLRDAGSEPSDAAPVAAWLARLARIVAPAYDGPHANANNHAYWTGLAVAAAGVAANDRELFTWGIAKYHVGVDQIRADGTLPLEMARGERALHYHLYALTPLVLLAEFGRANGLDLYAADGAAIRRLAERMLVAIDDPQSFAGPAHATQDITAGGTLSADEIEWIAPYAMRFPSPRTVALRHRYAALFDPRLGGDVTLIYPVGLTSS